jgi:fatty acid desaturase
MYAAVPCYNLGKLHKMIGHDLPPTPRGLFGVWREINYILKKQEADPTYQHEARLPIPATGLPSAAFNESHQSLNPALAGI